MATLKGSTLAATYDLLVKRHETYVQAGTNIELMTDSSGATAPTGLYLESGATTDNVGIGVADPDATLEILDTTTQLKLSYDATNYASFAVAADGLLNIVTVDPDGAEADICLNPDGNVGIGTTIPSAALHISGSINAAPDTSGEAVNSMLRLEPDSVEHVLDIGWYTGGGYAWIQPRHRTNYAANYHLALNPNGGKVGIGIVEPYSTLHIKSAGEGTIADGGDDAAPQLILESTGSTIGSSGPILCLHNSSEAVNNDYIGIISFTAGDSQDATPVNPAQGTEYANISARILDQTHDSTDGIMYIATDVNDTTTNTLYITGGMLGVGVQPTSMLHVDQASTTGAVPVLTLDQADVSEEFIEFLGVIGTGNSIQAKASLTLTQTHFIKVKLQGDLIRYIPVGTLA